MDELRDLCRRAKKYGTRALTDEEVVKIVRLGIQVNIPRTVNTSTDMYCERILQAVDQTLTVPNNDRRRRRSLHSSKDRIIDAINVVIRRYDDLRDEAQMTGVARERMGDSLLQLVMLLNELKSKQRRSLKYYLYELQQEVNNMDQTISAFVAARRINGSHSQ